MTTSIQSIDASTSSVQVGGQEAMRITTAGVVVASQNGGPLAGTRNRIINGNFIVNQRNVPTASASYGAGVYFLDRWKAGAGGATLSFALSGADVIVTITAGSIMQVVEDLNIEGGVYVLSHAGTAQARIGINGAAPAAAYANATRATPVVSASATAKQVVTVEFSTGTVSLVQLEPVDSANPKATPFERRHYGLELALCQRYLPAYNASSTSDDICTGQIVNTSGAQVFFQFFIEPRVSPTGVTVSNLAHFQFTTATLSSTLTAISFFRASKRLCFMSVTGSTTGWTANQPGLLVAVSTSGQLLFTGCEL
jgi:hypothetical protein